jgi:hypothetical protein
MNYGEDPLSVTWRKLNLQAKGLDVDVLEKIALQLGRDLIKAGLVKLHQDDDTTYAEFAFLLPADSGAVN